MSVTPQASPPLATPWVPLWPLGTQPYGDELVIQQFTAPVTCPGLTEATATTVVTAPAVTLDGSTPIIVEFYCPNLECTDQPDGSGWLYDGSTSIGLVWGIASARLATGKPNGPVAVRRELTPAAGTHTYSFRGSVSSGAGVIFRGGPGGVATWIPGFIRVLRVNPVPPNPSPGAVIPVTYGTTLPASPADGQEAILVDSVTNPTYQWRFRYNAGSSSPLKWEFVGGAAVCKALETEESTGSTTGVEATSATRITVPRAGEYLVTVAGTLRAAASGIIGTLAVRAFDGSILNAGWAASTGSSDMRHNVCRTLLLGATAGSYVNLAFFTNASTINLGMKSIEVIPVRVS